MAYDIEKYAPNSGRLLNEDSEVVNEANLAQSSLGLLGGKYIADTSATVPETGFSFVAVQVITDAVVTLVGDITGITAVELSVGTIIYGSYSSCTLASGSVIAYNGV
jgi:hypothetical protein